MAEGPGKLVLSEINYPGWRVEIDGQSLEHDSEQGLFRAVQIPQGEHEIRFSFRPPSVYMGVTISMLTLLAALYLVRRR
jgi:uncharacterized membrane protein YfhO